MSILGPFSARVSVSVSQSHTLFSTFSYIELSAIRPVRYHEWLTVYTSYGLAGRGVGMSASGDGWTRPSERYEINLAVASEGAPFGQ